MIVGLYFSSLFSVFEIIAPLGWTANFDSNWCTANAHSFASVQRLNVESDAGNVFIKDSLSDHATVCFESEDLDGISVEQVEDVLNVVNHAKSGWFWRGSRSVDFYISVPSSISVTEVKIGKGNVYDSSRVKNKTIAGGEIDFFGRDSYGDISFFAGKGSINLLYRNDSPEQPKVKCAVNSGKVTITTFLSDSFKTVGNVLKTPAMIFNSFLPFRESDDADFVVAGEAGSANVNISKTE